MAKKDRGWIKLHRQIVDSWIWREKEPFDDRSAWIDLLLMVNHESRVMPTYNKQTVTIEAGQLHTSMVHLAERWHWSRHRVIRYFKRLTEQGMCTVSGTPYGTTVTIVNWAFFQLGRTANGTANGTTDDTADGTTDGTQTRINIQALSNNKNELKKALGRSSSSSFGEELE